MGAATLYPSSNSQGKWLVEGQNLHIDIAGWGTALTIPTDKAADLVNRRVGGYRRHRRIVNRRPPQKACYHPYDPDRISRWAGSIPLGWSAASTSRPQYHGRDESYGWATDAKAVQVPARGGAPAAASLGVLLNRSNSRRLLRRPRTSSCSGKPRNLKRAPRSLTMLSRPWRKRNVGAVSGCPHPFLQIRPGSDWRRAAQPPSPASYYFLEFCDCRRCSLLRRYIREPTAWPEA